MTYIETVKKLVAETLAMDADSWFDCMDAWMLCGRLRRVSEWNAPAVNRALSARVVWC